MKCLISEAQLDSVHARMHLADHARRCPFHFQSNDGRALGLLKESGSLVVEIRLS